MVDAVSSPQGHALYEKAVRVAKKKEYMRKLNPEGCTFSPEMISSSPTAKKLRSKRTKEDLYADAKKREARLKKRVEEELSHPSGCTFSPHITTKAKKSKGTPGRKRSEMLYANAAQTAAKKKVLGDKLQKAKDKECTFRPKITAKAKRSSSPHPKNRKVDLRARASKLAEERKALELKGCTFQPNINKRRPVSAPRSRPVKSSAPSAGSVHERLNAYAARRRQKLEELREEKRAKEDRDLTFRPALRLSSSGTEKQPARSSIHERLYKDAKKKRNAKKSGASAKRRHSFDPAKKRRGGGSSIFDRLCADNERKKNLIEEREREKEKRELKQCTFKPKISRGSETATYKGKQKIWERLHAEREGVQLLRAEIRRRKEMAECTFAPAVSSSSSSSSTNNNVFDRLTNSERITSVTELREIKRQELEMEDCTFQPHVSEASRTINTFKSNDSTPAWRRLSMQPTKTEKAEAREEERAALELKDCTFAPEISSAAASKKSKHLGETKSFLSRVREQSIKQKKKEIAANEVKRARSIVRAMGAKVAGSKKKSKQKVAAVTTTTENADGASSTATQNSGKNPLHEASESADILMIDAQSSPEPAITAEIPLEDRIASAMQKIDLAVTKVVPPKGRASAGENAA